jgi:hypothetical protein
MRTTRKLVRASFTESAASEKLEELCEKCVLNLLRDGFVKTLLCTCLIILITGCVDKRPLTVDSLKLATYDLPETGAITFTNGSYDRRANGFPGKTILHINHIDLYAFGDLNGDGAADGITFLSRRMEGPEIFLSMEVFLNTGGDAVHSGGAIIGDRVAIDSVTIQHQVIRLYLITQGPGDAMCCPMLHVKKEFRLVNNQLTEMPSSDNLHERKE